MCPYPPFEPFHCSPFELNYLSLTALWTRRYGLCGSLAACWIFGQFYSFLDKLEMQNCLDNLELLDGMAFAVLIFLASGLGQLIYCVQFWTAYLVACHKHIIFWPIWAAWRWFLGSMPWHRPFWLAWRVPGSWPTSSCLFGWFWRLSMLCLITCWQAILIAWLEVFSWARRPRGIPPAPSRTSYLW